MKRVVVTGSGGLIGWHTSAHLHAANCQARFNQSAEPYDIVPLDHAGFDSDDTLHSALTGADIILHFAGVNRASDDIVEAANPAIATRLIAACTAAGSDPHIVYANSTHFLSDTPYGRGKKTAGDILETGVTNYTNLVLPHIFGECARPFYNNVTATLIAQILTDEDVTVNPHGKVELLHAGAAARTAIEAAETRKVGLLQPNPRPISVPDLYDKLHSFHSQYQANVYPDLSDPFDLALFNSYRAASYPSSWPRSLKLNTDARGTLFEAVKGGGGGQSFLSTTKPGVTRGDHFHLNKVERFLVVQGEAMIRVRKVLGDEVWEYRVSGNTPAPVDMPTLHTHSIENIGEGDLLTLFWTHDLFDPQRPDTYADKAMT